MYLQYRLPKVQTLDFGPQQEFWEETFWFYAKCTDTILLSEQKLRTDKETKKQTKNYMVH